MDLGILHILVVYGISFLILLMFVRFIASLFRIDERNAIIRFCARMTDPFITPIRRIVRPVGFLDLSFIIAWFLLITIQTLLSQALPPGW